MLVDLTWDNYLELNDYIHSQNFKKEYFTPVVTIQWQFYGLYFKYRKLKDAVIIYLKNTNENLSFQKNIKDLWVVYASYYSETFSFHENIEVIKQDLNYLNGNSEIILFDFLVETYTDWKIENINLVESKYISNYIYELDKMRTFSGKKLQKKRNHLNAFIKENHNIKIIDIKDVNPQELIDYTIHHIKKYSESYRQYEVDVYKKYLFEELKKDDRYMGSAFYIDNKLVAYTLGFVNKDTYEVIIEKAERDIRGLYQYVISENIKFNNINVAFMDREDDAGIEELAKSKSSYYPILAIKRYSTIYGK